MKNAFSIIITFIALSIVGAAFVPLINVQLKPNKESPTLSVSYSWYNASANLLEQEVTSKLEGIFSGMRDVRNVSSVSRQGSGNINLEFKENADIDAVRFELATLIRMAHPDLPEQVSYPEISQSGQKNQAPAILTYRLNADVNSNNIQKVANNKITPKLSLIDGVNNVLVYGAMPNEWLIVYDVDKISSLGIKVSDISSAISSTLADNVVGAVRLSDKKNEGLIQLTLRNRPDTIMWEKIPVKKSQDRIVFLNDIATVSFQEKKPQSYYRINGLNTINVVVYPEKGVNTIKLAAEVKKEAEKLKAQLPNGFSLIMDYDASQDLKDELEKLGLRAVFSLVILLVFVLIMSRKLRYLVLILTSLVVNLLVACVLYYALDIEIQLYSLAGITISFGIIIDNSIIMIHHFLTRGNRKVFLSILAASLTTIGSLIIIFFLNENQQLNLVDFAWVIIINLSVSLFVALFLIPALLQKLPLQLRKKKKRSRFNIKGWLFRFYCKFTLFNKRIKWIYYVLIILVFGIPFHLLPERIEKEGFWPDLYNETFGSNTYQLDIKPIVDTWMAGTFRLFSENVFGNSFFSEPQKTSLNIRGSMPEGCNVHQMNEVMVKMENYLSQFPEIKMYKTSVRSHNDASIAITFHPEYEEGSFPYEIKGAVTSKANGWGGLDWSIYGVGKGFNNAIREGSRNSTIVLHGYNYDQLYAYAELLSKKLKQNKRVDNLIIESSISWYAESLSEYDLSFNFENFSLYQQNFYEFYQYINNRLYETNVSNINTGGELCDVVLKSNQTEKFDLWSLKNIPFESGDKAIKLSSLAKMEKGKTGNSIHKKNQQYQLVVSYDFVGPDVLSEKVQKTKIEEMNKVLPMGYKCSKPDYGRWDKDDTSQYYVLFIVVLVIYFICSILFESLTMPLVIIAMIPISFIGVFVTFYFFGLNFDQGGFASFVLLCGVTVNAGIYLINEYKQLRSGNNQKTRFEIYTDAFKNKITPIFLTIISTILGLVPFVYSGQGEVFWFSFAVGSIGGLIFSFVAIIIYLPLMMKLSVKQAKA